MKKYLAALLAVGVLLTGSAGAVTLTLDGAPLDLGETPVYENTTYVPLRALVEAVYPDAAVTWQAGSAAVSRQGLDLTATPGTDYLLSGGEALALGRTILLEQGRTLVPIRPLARLLGLEVGWNGATGEVSLTSARCQTASAWDEDDLYWLSRIISAESQGECWEGKIAVGNVVLNRVASDQFPDTIYDVIFDARWGGQFEPVRNGTIYNAPTDESVQAAMACLNGASVVGDSLYFLAPSLTSNHWTMANRVYVTTIGVHWFYR